MAVALNHTIVASRDKRHSAEFLCRILGVEGPKPFAHFLTVELANGVSLDFDNAETVRPQHYAFLVDESDFDAIRARITAEHLAYYADPGHRRQGEINTRDEGRGLYFDDPNGHHLEILTRPYGSSGGRDD